MIILLIRFDHHLSLGVPIRLKPGVILSLGFSDSATTARVICYVRRDTSFREKRQKRERKGKRARHPEQPVREKSRPFIGTRRFLPDVSSFLRDGTAAYGSEEIERAIVAVVTAYRYHFLATAKS